MPEWVQTLLDLLDRSETDYSAFQEFQETLRILKMEGFFAVWYQRRHRVMDHTARGVYRLWITSDTCQYVLFPYLLVIV